MKFKYERQKPEEITRRAIEKGAQKLKQVISEESFKITPRVEEKLDGLISDLKEKQNVEVNHSDIMRIALETLNKEQGALPENLQEEYIDLTAKDLAERVKGGEALYKVLSKRMVELKRQGFEIDGKIVEEKVRELIK